MERKKVLDWDVRNKELVRLLDKYRSSNGAYDCIIPVSGGKDGSYVSYKLKHEYGMNPLTMTVRPALSLDIGNVNLNNFIESGYSHIHISPDTEAMQVLNKIGLIEKGLPYYGWLISIQASILRMAINMGIQLIFYGEDGEVEYGGSSKTENIAEASANSSVLTVTEYDDILNTSNLTEGQRYFFNFPSKEELEAAGIFITRMSYFESWDPYRNYMVAKEKCGLQEKDSNNLGTFTNFAQNDQALYSLHTYLMYLKFGFGRATQDVGVEIRREAMTREQGLNLVRVYDDQYPSEYINLYLDYYNMTREEFDLVLDKWANNYLFEKCDGIWKAKFKIN